MTLDGVLPRGATIRGPALVTPFDLPAWLAHQQEQHLAGTPPHAHTHPHHSFSLALGQRRGGDAAKAAAAAAAAASAKGGGGAPPPCYQHSLQARASAGLRAPACCTAPTSPRLRAGRRRAPTRARPPPPPPAAPQALNNCFLYRMPLARLALVVRCLPEVRANLLAQYTTYSAAVGGGGGGGAL